MRFKNRQDAGRRLAEKLMNYKEENPVVLGLPRGGVPVAYEVAEALEAPLDVVVARKVGAPFQEELALGAVVDGDQPETVFNEDILKRLNLSHDDLQDKIEAELEEVRQRQELFRKGRAPVSTEDATAIIIDDGLATGASMRAAIRGLKRRPIMRLVVGVPVGPPSSVEELRAEADDVVCLHAPEGFRAVGQFYEDFDQTTNEEVIELLEKAHHSVLSKGK